ncbi:MAG: immunoglobulin domain-containing protein, partial [Bacteroidales bacterium]|nr:immunoglobulin domain-containing protein [Bacteroidales bacterium]
MKKIYLVSLLVLIFSGAGLKSQTVTFSKKDVTCFSGSDGEITMQINGGSSVYMYYYYKVLHPSVIDSFGPTTNLNHTFFNLDADLYNAFVLDTVTDNVLDYNTINITQPAILSADVSSTNSDCFGASNGTITISSPSGGSGVYEYSINAGSSWQSTGGYTDLGPATYTVLIRDANATSCVRTLDPGLTITEPGQLNANLNSTNVTCYNKSDGTIIISSPSGGSGSYQYTINGGISWQPSGNYTGLGPGTYNVQIRDAAAITCFRVLNNALVITQPDVLNVNDIIITKGLTCNEGSDGQLQAVVSGGTTPYTYDWYVHNGSTWVTINQYTQTATSLPQGWYEVRVNDANNCGSPTPASAREFFLEGATDSIPPMFYFDSASVVNTCQGQTNGSITIYAHGGKTPYSYSITTGGASGYQSGNTFSGLAAGTYETWARDSKGCTKNGPSKTVATEPNQPVSVSITANPSGSICPGTSVLFTATPVNGGTTPSYQWRLNGTPVGSDSPNYTTSTLIDGDQVNAILTSSLRCTSGNPATSNTITASVLVPPAITDQPDPVTQCQGTNATFSVTATGSGLTYQWRKNGANISGANNASYTINNITPADAGNYSVVVTGTCGTVTSNNASLTVQTPPVISDQPDPVTQCEGTNATFTVTATGTITGYQWRKNSVNISGATNSTYTINNIAPADAGSYDVVITGPCGTVTSNAAALTVQTAPVITDQPDPLTQCEGTDATFSVTATGTITGYQWRKNSVNISGATNPAYTINNIAPADAGSYDVVITGPCGSVTSNAAALPVQTAPVITDQPDPLTQCEGTDAAFSVTVTGTGLSYQWRKGGTNISGATNASYTINNITPADAGSYDVVITGTCGAVTSNAATLTVQTAPVITDQPDPVTQCEGTNATFTVAATGTITGYQWRKNGVNISGATNPAYTINNIAPADAGSYDVVITGPCGTVTSNAATLIVQTAPVITDQPDPVTQCQGTDATFSVTATGTITTYQWRKNSVNISGATNPAYTINNITPADAGSYDVVITGPCGTVTSNAATLTVQTAPVITDQPDPVTQCQGTNAAFSVTATGTITGYQWRKNGVNISGATNTTYTINNIAPADAGNYDVVITGPCGTVTSNVVTLTVQTPPVITDQPDPLTQCQGTDATFSVTATGTGLAYQWRKDGSDISGAANASYTINNITPADAGSYDVVITGTCGTVTSTAATLTVQTAPVITDQPDNVTQCQGTDATFSVTATGTITSYQWRKNGVNISGATNTTLTINNITPADAGSYDVVITGPCGTVTSDAATLTVQTPPVITDQPDPLTQCEGTDATFTVAATGTGLTYQWRKNGTNISGATNAGYTINNITPADAGNYDVVITGTCGTVTSNAVALIVQTAPVITNQPDNVTQCEGTNATFTVTATGTGLTYQWRKNGSDISGATNTSYAINNITPADAGSYDVVITGTCGTVTSTA